MYYHLFAYMIKIINNKYKIDIFIMGSNFSICMENWEQNLFGNKRKLTNKKFNKNLYYNKFPPFISSSLNNISDISFNIL